MAILLVVAFHIEVWAPAQPPDYYKGLLYILRFIRMPLFTVLSGYVYALRPMNPGSGLKFLAGKARRLILPMVFVGIIPIFFLKLSPPYVEAPKNFLEILKPLAFPPHQFWFLQTLFFVFVLITVLECLKWLEKPSIWLLAMGLIALAALLAGSGILKFINPPVSPRPFIFMLPYFFFGLGLSRFKLLRQKRWVTFIALSLAVVGLTLQLFVLTGRLKIADQRDTVFYLSLSLVYIFLLFKIRWNAPWLSKLGNFSYSIFLFHFYIILVMNKVLTALPLALPPAARFAVLFPSAVGLSILAHLVLKRFAITRRLFLGLR